MDITSFQAAEEYYTLLAVRADGVAPVMDLVMAEGLDAATAAARAMLNEHASCANVEIWRGGRLLDQVSR